MTGPTPKMVLMLEYLRSGKTQAETARHFRVSSQAVSQACERYGLPQRRQRFRRADYVWDADEVRLLRQFWKDGVSTPEIGRRLGTSKDAVIGKAHRLGLGPHPTAPRPVWRDVAARRVEYA